MIGSLIPSEENHHFVAPIELSSEAIEWVTVSLISFLLFFPRALHDLPASAYSRHNGECILQEAPLELDAIGEERRQIRSLSYHDTCVQVENCEENSSPPIHRHMMPFLHE